MCGHTQFPFPKHPACVPDRGAAGSHFAEVEGPIGEDPGREHNALMEAQIGAGGNEGGVLPPGQGQIAAPQVQAQALDGGSKGWDAIRQYEKAMLKRHR